MSDRIYAALGMMSGTSMDGIDISLIRTDGQGHNEIVRHGSMFVPYTEEVKAALRKVLGYENIDHFDVMEAEQLITRAYINALDEYWRKSGIAPSQIDVIGAHGQTITHKPEKGLTIQLGNAQKIADYAGVPVVFDLRQNDVQNGGQGAPLLPVYHMALLAGRVQDFPVAVLNLGGVGNITYLPAADLPEKMMAFDTGPANAYLDDWVNYKDGREMDVDGALASAGEIHGEIVDKFLDGSYFEAPAPKSLDRNEFVFLLDDVKDLSLEDGAATLTECTVQSVATAFDQFPSAPKMLYVCGGGARNAYMMERLQHVLSEICVCQVEKFSKLGVETDYIEAQGFAYMAVRHLLSLPISFKGTTGVPQALTGGQLYTPHMDEVSKPDAAVNVNG